jgi:uncharacterized protein YkwD
MKILLFLFLLQISGYSLSQVATDTVDLKNVNHSFLSELILEKCNEERAKVGAVPFIPNKVCQMTAQYQSDYMSHFLTPTHYNNNTFQGVKLYGPEDRVDYFNKKNNSKYLYDGEICFSIYDAELYMKYTYEQLAMEAINGFMNSLPHRTIMLTDLEKMQIPAIQYGSFATSSNITNGKFSYYVTGAFIYVNK